MKYFLSAGEKSGDLHGSNLIKEIKLLDEQSSFFGVGGDLMNIQGQQQVFHFKKISFMGFWEVIKNLFTVVKYLRITKKAIAQIQPDVLILIDFAGFNLKLAAYAKSLGIPVHYYISPKVWAWNENRAFKIKKLVDRMFVILPFEKEFYKQFDFEVDFVGNPVMDAIRDHKRQPIAEISQIDQSKLVAVLPGSRVQEIKHMMDVLPQIIEKNPDWVFLIAKVDHVDPNLYSEVQSFSNVFFAVNRTYDLLLSSRAAIVTSGTATLETALLRVPQVVVYKTSAISYSIAKRLIKVRFISLVNLILNSEVVKELIQDEFNPTRLNGELSILIEDSEERQAMLAEYDRLLAIMSNEKASQNTARLIISDLQKAHPKQP